jgi:oligoendopeptidase F
MVRAAISSRLRRRPAPLHFVLPNSRFARIFAARFSRGRGHPFPPPCAKLLSPVFYPEIKSMNQPFRFDKDEGSPAGILTRDQVKIEDTWDLAALFATPEAWSEAFVGLQKTYEAAAQFRGRVGSSAAVLRECLEFDKALNLTIERLGHYASLRSSEDSSDAANLAREGQFENLLTRIAEALAFVEPEIQEIGDATFESFLADPALADWQIPLRKLRRLKRHTLSIAEERLLALGQSAVRGHSETFSQLTNVDMKFGTLVDEKGVERPLSLSTYSSFRVKRDPELRKRAFHQMFAEFSDHKYTLASSLANSVKADVFHARARNYPSAREAALFRDDVPVAVYDNLIGTVRANLQPLFRYYQLRKRVLKLGEIHQYDTYVPIVPDIETHVSFDEAVEKVLAALAPLGEEYCRVLGDGLRSRRWCDRFENKGKRSGAFSSSSYGNPPFMLMNYKEDVFSDIYTLAHEAGHSMHSWYSQRAQPFQTYDYPIFLAEVASTFNEELLTHHLIEATDDPKMRAYLINRQIDDIRGTVYRQTMFAEFEKITHAMEEAGEPLTLDSFRQAYRGLLNAYFGPDFVIDSELELECFYIPHFYSAFYVYKYSTGLSAAVALSEQVLAGGDVERYLDFLRSGGSSFPIPTLQKAGVDMSVPGPIERTLQLFARRVEELEGLLA